VKHETVRPQPLLVLPCPLILPFPSAPLRLCGIWFLAFACSTTHSIVRGYALLRFSTYAVCSRWCPLRLCERLFFVTLRDCGTSNLNPIRDTFSFDVQHRDPQTVARTGLLTTAHGSVRTPAFVGVATRATIKALEPQALVNIGLQIVISNTYHLHLQPGEDVIASLGGLHAFSGWNRPTMTDSGGFQVFSLGASKDHGVGKVASIFPGNKVSAKPKIRSILDGSLHTFTPESVITIERKLGADIIVPLDECTSPLHDHAYTKNSMERTHRWAQRGLTAFQLLKDDPTFPNPDQVLYGIVQGGAYHDLRLESARFIGDMAFDGFAIGERARLVHPPAARRSSTSLAGHWRDRRLVHVCCPRHRHLRLCRTNSAGAKWQRISQGRTTASHQSTKRSIYER